MFENKAGAHPSELPTLGLAPGLTHIKQTWLERLATDKHSSLLQKFVNCRCKKSFITLGPGGDRESPGQNRNLLGLGQQVSPARGYIIIKKFVIYRFS
jgi:hypothetical protein